MSIFEFCISPADTLASPLRASAFVPLPRWVREKKAVVNVAGTGDDCFKWAVLAWMHPAGKHEPSNRMSTYVKKYDFSSLPYPVPLSSIASFATTIYLLMYMV